ncbi:YIP1 family protein [Candidatus Pacearchaeota archaeon]|nr:YIP1 family protein [Candidatus Pacearchaeota archaeon]
MAKRGKKEVEANKSEIKNEEKSSISFKIPNFKQMFLKPSSFLNSIEKQDKYQPLIRDFVILYIFWFIISLIITAVASKVPFNSELLSNAVLGFVNGVVFSVIAPFILAGMTHAILKIFKAKEGFLNTYKPIVYALMIAIIYGFIMLIVGLIIQFTIPIDSSMFQAITTVQDQNTVIQAYKDYISQPGAIILLIINLIAVIHIFVFSVMGIMKFQKMQRIKAGFAVILAWIIIFALLVLLAILTSSQAAIA